jgi:hypothetical protein
MGKAFKKRARKKRREFNGTSLGLRRERIPPATTDEDRYFARPTVVRCLPVVLEWTVSTTPALWKILQGLHWMTLFAIPLSKPTRTTRCSINALTPYRQQEVIQDPDSPENWNLTEIADGHGTLAGPNASSLRAALECCDADSSRVMYWSKFSLERQETAIRRLREHLIAFPDADEDDLSDGRLRQILALASKAHNRQLRKDLRQASRRGRKRRKNPDVLQASKQE